MCARYRAKTPQCLWSARHRCWREVISVGSFCISPMPHLNGALGARDAPLLTEFADEGCPFHVSSSNVELLYDDQVPGHRSPSSLCKQAERISLKWEAFESFPAPRGSRAAGAALVLSTCSRLPSQLRIRLCRITRFWKIVLGIR